jgi:murein DD-endopeptidase MepM/ murein hydrolase activator NlpD
MRRFIISESEKKYIKQLYQLNEIDSKQFATDFLDYAMSIAKQQNQSSQTTTDNSDDQNSLETTNDISGDKLYSPLKNTTFPTGNFGVNRPGLDKAGKTHPGIDLTAASGTELFSPADGIVTDAKLRKNACGGTLEIKHGNGLKTRYCHLKQIDVKKNDKVKLGQKVGLTGGHPQNDNNPGFSTGPHLHFEVYKDGKLVDPLKYVIQKFYDGGTNNPTV